MTCLIGEVCWHLWIRSDCEWPEAVCAAERTLQKLYFPSQSLFHSVRCSFQLCLGLVDPESPFFGSSSEVVMHWSCLFCHFQVCHCYQQYRRAKIRELLRPWLQLRSSYPPNNYSISNQTFIIPNDPRNK